MNETVPLLPTGPTPMGGPGVGAAQATFGAIGGGGGAPEEDADVRILIQAEAAHQGLRNAFLRRVYFLLAIQLLITSGIVAVCTLVPQVRTFVLAHSQLVSWSLVLACLVLFFKLLRMKDQYPTNGIILALFTIFQSFLIGTTCAVFSAHGLTKIVLIAAALSIVAFIGLTIFTFVWKGGFSYLGGFVVSTLFMLMTFGLINLMFGFQSSVVCAMLGAMLFCGLIVAETLRMSRQCSLDDYLVACIHLYLDIFMVFVMLLQLLTGFLKPPIK